MGFFRNFLKGASLTTALFIFQACYGTPSWLDETDVSFKVISAEDGSPIKDVSVYTRVYESENLDWNLRGYTNEEGIANVLVGVMEGRSPQLRFEAEGNQYAVKDTVIADLSHSRLIEIKLQKAE